MTQAAHRPGRVPASKRKRCHAPNADRFSGNSPDNGRQGIFLTVFTALLILIVPLSAALAQSAMNSDASQMISGSGALSSTFQTALLSLLRLPEALLRGVQWVGGVNEWGGVLFCVALSIATGELAHRFSLRLLLRHAAPQTTPGYFIRVLVACGLFFIAGLIVLALLPRWPRVHGVATVLFLVWGAVLTIGGLSGHIFRAVDVDGAAIVRRIRLAVAIAGLSYLAIGLVRLGGGNDDTLAMRLTGGLLFWIAFLLVAGSIISRFHMLSSSWTSPTTAASDPILQLLLHHTSVFFGTMLFFLGGFVVVMAYTAGAYSFFRGFISVGLLGALPAIVAILPLLFRDGGTEDHPWRQTFVHCARLFVFIGFWITLAFLWDINPFATTDTSGQKAARILVDISIAVALAYMLWDIARTALDRFAQPKRALLLEDADESGSRTATRIQTFVPLVRASTLAFIIAATAMIVLASLGVNIGPLLAGAGIIGVAVGFGSQALVKDIISGIFFLADDAFRLGEYVEIGEAKGTVEGISIRSLKLRHPRGALYTMPFGEMRLVNNQSRDFVIVKLEFTVPFDTDLMRAKKAVKTVAAEIEADPELAQNLLQPLKFQGVRRMEPYGIVVGVKFTAKPMEQWILRREVFARVRDGFAAVDIHFASPQVTVQVPGNEHWDDKQRHAAAQAAATAVVSQASSSAPSPAKE